MGLREELVELMRGPMDEGEGPFEWRMTSVDWQQCRDELEPHETRIIDGQATIYKGLFGYPAREKPDGAREFNKCTSPPHAT